MRNYHINTDRLVNQLTPYYMGGRKFILFVQSILSPLQPLSDKFAKWAHDIYQESAMTSQVFLLEHFLNERFSKYFSDPQAKIKIEDTEIEGVVVYWEYVNAKKRNLPLFDQAEDSQHHTYLFWKDEKQKYTGISFIVSCPAINTEKISQTEMTRQLGVFVNRYRIAGKTFKINYNTK